MTEYVTKISQLTPANVGALGLARDAGAIEIRHLGATYAILPGTIEQALAMVQADMDQLKGAGTPVRETRYQSLIAVRNKLRDHRNVVEAELAGETTTRGAGAELTPEQYLEEIDRLRRELPGNHGADAFLLGWTAGLLTGEQRAAAIEGARTEFAHSLAREAARREQKVAEVVTSRTEAEAGAELAGERECEAPEPAAVTNHTAAQAEGPLSAAPTVSTSCSIPDCAFTRAHYHRGDDEIVFTDPDIIAATAAPAEDRVPVRLSIDLEVDPKAWALAFGVEGPAMLDDVATYVQNLLQCCAVVEEECWSADTVRVGAEIRDTE